MYTNVHSDVFWERYPFEFFNLHLDVSLVWKINQGYMANVSLWILLILGVKVLHSKHVSHTCADSFAWNLSMIESYSSHICMELTTMKLKVVCQYSLFKWSHLSSLHNQNRLNYLIGYSYITSTSRISLLLARPRAKPKVECK